MSVPISTYLFGSSRRTITPSDRPGSRSSQRGPRRLDFGMQHALVTASLEQFAPGVVLQAPLYEPRGDRLVLLAAAGTVISSALLDLLRQRGTSRLLIEARELRRLVQETGPSSPPGDAASAPPSPQPFSPRLRAEMVANCAAAAQKLEELFSDLSGTGDVSAGATLAVTEGAWEDLSQDRDLFVSLGNRPTRGAPRTHSHGLQAAMLAMAVARDVGLPKDEILELSSGCLIHDAGMLLIDPAIPALGRKLTSLEFLEIQKHPIRIYDRIQDLPEVGAGARSVIYQMHERCNGSGYPRGIHGDRIHPLAKIAAVADVYTALVAPRPHRPAWTPYKAMEQVLREARGGLLDPVAVRALLHTLSLFPIGSGIRTSDGRVGRVLRSNGEQYTRPVVEIWHPDDPTVPIEVVDLARQSEAELTVSRALPELPPRPIATAAARADGDGSGPPAGFSAVDEDMWE